MLRYRHGSELAYQIFIHVLIGIIAATAVFPLVYAAGMSLTSQSELIKRNYFVIIPWEPTLHGYERVLKTPAIWNSLVISLLRSTIGPILALLLTLTGAYVLTVKTLPGRSFFLFMVLATILFSGGLIPNYLVMRKLGLLNTFWVLVFPMMGHSFGLLIIKVFIENLPDGLIESARIDGAGHGQMLVWIVTPLTAPVLAAIGMFSIVDHWNAWFDALVYLTKDRLWPIQLILRNILIGSFNTTEINLKLIGKKPLNPEALKMTTVVIGILPLLAVYPFLQKYFIKGVYLGAVKG